MAVSLIGEITYSHTLNAYQGTEADSDQTSP
jgi:hypothetical protein